MQMSRLSARIPHTSRPAPGAFRTKVRSRADSSEASELPLDKETRLGRPGVNPRETFGRANGFELMFRGVGETTVERLLRAQTEEEIIAAFGDDSYHRDRMACGPLPRLILEARKDHDWPMKSRKAQIRFLARSMAAFGTVSGRRSRAICREEERRQDRG